MDIYAKTKGTSLEKTIQGQSQAELSGAGMYFALARAAKGHHMDDVAKEFTELAVEHAAQASYYAMLAGRYPLGEEKDYWQFVKGLSKAEEFGEKAISGLALKAEEAGLADIAPTVREFAAQHKRHAEVTKRFVEAYAPEISRDNTKSRYVCSVCGYVYEGDFDKEPDTFTCPICTMPKSAFKPQE